MRRLRDEATTWGLTLALLVAMVIVYALLFRGVHGMWPPVQ